MDVKICPRCNSPNVNLDQNIWWGDRVYLCKRCGFSSPLFKEITVKNANELKKLKLKLIKKAK